MPNALDLWALSSEFNRILDSWTQIIIFCNLALHSDELNHMQTSYWRNSDYLCVKLHALCFAPQIV